MSKTLGCCIPQNQSKRCTTCPILSLALQDKCAQVGCCIGDSLIGFYRQFSQSMLGGKNQGLISPASQIPPSHLSLFVTRYSQWVGRFVNSKCARTRDSLENVAPFFTVNGGLTTEVGIPASYIRIAYNFTSYSIKLHFLSSTPTR